MVRSTYTYGEYTLIRSNDVSFEIEGRDGKRYVLFAPRDSYYGDFYVQSKDDQNMPASKRNSIISASKYASTNLGISRYNPYRLEKYRLKTNRTNLTYINEVIEELSTAKNPAFIGNYCVGLLYEISKLDSKETVKCLEKLLDYLDKTTNIASYCLNDFLKRIDGALLFHNDLRRKVYFALALSSISLQDCTYIKAQIESELKAAIREKSDGLEKLLERFPVISESGKEADFLMERYNGLGMKPSFFVLYMTSKGESDKLYQLLLSKPSYFKSALNEEDGVKPLELFRFLASHGYQDKTREMAKVLIALTRSSEDYFALRVFLKDEDILEIFLKTPSGDGYGGKSGRDLPILLDKKAISEKLKENKYYYFYDSNHYKAEAYSYGYSEGELSDFDYGIKEIRNGLRERLLNTHFDEKDIGEAMGLLSFGDKTTQRYFLTEFDQDYPGNPSYALVKAYIGDRLGKKVKGLYEYPEGK